MQVGVMIDSYVFVIAWLNGDKPSLKAYDKNSGTYIIYELCNFLHFKLYCVANQLKICHEMAFFFLTYHTMCLH